EWETETVSWLVLHHLMMSHTAFKRDIDNPKTISDFAQAVQSPERLRLLLILTVADIRAVGPNVWNAWKAGLLRELYYRVQEALAGEIPSERRAERVEHAKRALTEKLADWPAEEIEKHIKRGHSNYWLAFDTDTLIHHARLVRDAETEDHDLHIKTRIEAERDVTEIIIYAPDHPGLFATIAGAMALAGASVVDAKIMTLANGMALDTFWIQDAGGHTYAAQDRLKRLTRRIEDALLGRVRPARELEKAQKESIPSRTRVFKVPPGVLIDNKASNHHTVIEINGRDRPGLLHDVTRALTAAGLQISSAHVSTYGERVVDVFYVKDVFGLKLEKEEKLESLRARLLDAVSPGSAAEEPGAEGAAKGADGKAGKAKGKGRAAAKSRSKAAAPGNAKPKADSKPKVKPKPAKGKAGKAKRAKQSKAGETERLGAAE
ncbi:MAG: ACT domain-containing protein, partial [Rhodospirillales bacterium]